MLGKVPNLPSRGLFVFNLIAFIYFNEMFQMHESAWVKDTIKALTTYSAAPEMEGLFSNEKGAMWLLSGARGSRGPRRQDVAAVSYRGKWPVQIHHACEASSISIPTAAPVTTLFNHFTVGEPPALRPDRGQAPPQLRCSAAPSAPRSDHPEFFPQVFPWLILCEASWSSEALPNTICFLLATHRPQPPPRLIFWVCNSRAQRRGRAGSGLARVLAFPGGWAPWMGR